MRRQTAVVVTGVLTAIVRVVVLVVMSHRAWPAMPLERVTVAVIHAVDSETKATPAELLLAIGAHESDLQPNAVSYVMHGHRRDGLWTNLWIPPDRVMTCGYGQTVARGRMACAAIIADHGGMTAAAAELGEWMGRSHGDMRRALAGYTNGNRGFRAGRSAFGDGFLRRARQLGMGWQAS
jgi:hypothetical protein